MNHRPHQISITSKPNILAGYESAIPAATLPHHAASVPRRPRRRGQEVRRNLGFVIERGVSEASASTIGRWLAEDAIRPWQYRSWIFPLYPDFPQKAGRVLDLYQGRWEGKLLEPGTAR